MPLLPEDFSENYHQSAPLDQQIPGFLLGGEEVLLRNLTPEGLMRFALPRIALGCITHLGNSSRRDRFNLHTVLIKPDQRLVCMVWHAAIPCHQTLYQLRDSVVYEKQVLSAAYSPGKVAK